MTQYPITGIDVSRWQKQIDWEQALAQGISFAMIKASEGNKIIDSMYERNMAETGRLSIPRGIYHFLKPGHDWKAQAELFATLVNESGIELDAAYDIERHDDMKKFELANVIEKTIKHTEDKTGRHVMIYTSPGFWNSYLPMTGWAKHRRLWVAHWTNQPLPTLPEEWAKPGKTWTFWQWSAKNQLGGDYGVATKSVDLNRFNGSAAEFSAAYDLDSMPEPIEPPLPVPGPVFQVLVPALHVFNAPDVNSAIVGELGYGDTVTLADLRGTDEVWLQTNPDQWVLFAYNGRQLLGKAA